MERTVLTVWAISVHKAQGSAFKRVIIPVVRSKLLDRTMLYTPSLGVLRPSCSSTISITSTKSSPWFQNL